MTNLKEKIKDCDKSSRGNNFYKWIAYVSGTIAYMFVNFHRVNTTVLAPYFIETFKVSNINLGFMSSIYFYSYAALQPVVGVLTDRWKPRKMLTLSVIMMTFGTLIYVYSPTFNIIFFGRFLIGLGSAGVMVPVSWIVTKYFAYDKRGFLFAIFMFIGNMGSILAASPFAKLITYFGWRNVLSNSTYISFALAVLIWLVVRDDNLNKINEANLNNKYKKSAIKIEEEKSSWLVVCREVVSIPIVKYCFFSSLTYATMMSFQGLWAVPFFMDIYKMERTAASDLLTMIPIGLVAGTLLLSKLNDTKYGQYIFFFVNATSLIVYLIFTISTVNLPNTFIIILLFLIGFSMSVTPFLLKIYSVVLPKKHYGTAMGIVNMFPFILSAVYQSGTGLLFDLFGGGASVLHRSLVSYKLYFLFLTLSVAIATLAILKIIKILNQDYKGKI